MTKLGIQISSVKEYFQTPGEVLESFRKVSDIGYETIQIQWINPEVPIEFIQAALKETNLKCIGTQDYYDVVIEMGVKYAFAEQETFEKEPFQRLKESYDYLVMNGIK